MCLLLRILRDHSTIVHRGDLVITVSVFLLAAAAQATAQQEIRRFTVSDDIALTHCDNSARGPAEFSPDGMLFAVLSERGRLDLNRSESSLRIYRTRDAADLLALPDNGRGLAPLWTVTKSTYKNGPVISGVRWLADSIAVAFLAKTPSGNDRLFLAHIQTKTAEPLTPEDQHVTGFDIRDSRHFVYSVLSPAIYAAAARESEATVIVGTGRALGSLVFPEGSVSPSVWVHDLSELWAVVDGRRFRVTDASSHRPIPIHLEGQRSLALSPDSRLVVTALTVSSIPSEWETLYPSPFPAYRIRAGRQDPSAFKGQRDVSEYVLIDLSNGRIKPLTHAPMGNPLGWWGFSRADWAGDSRSIVLSDTFLPAKTRDVAGAENRPCVAVADVVTDQMACVERLEVLPMEKGRQFVDDVHFAAGKGNRITVGYFGIDGAPSGSRSYVRLGDGSWIADATQRDSASTRTIDISLRQGPNEPPVLIATDTKTRNPRIIWNPNPQLKHIRMGEVSVFRWKDKAGRDWAGGLYKPPDYMPGKPHPLVIQTHGFEESEFQPSGSSTTAFAAQELAGVGFLVLQVRDCRNRDSEEGSCQVAGYEAAVAKLAADGVVDPARVGIIGFSRTCYYVLEALTKSTVQFKAASITDGINHGYLQYMLDIDGDSRNSVAHEGEVANGGAPFGPGLQQWLRRSPEFNMDRVTAPLLVVATRQQVVDMWEPYAGLRYLKKPVDLLVLNSDEHVFTNPIMRLISQGGTVDWFRFWLQDYEDRDPAKFEQYKRWRELRKLQEQNGRLPLQASPPSVH